MMPEAAAGSRAPSEGATSIAVLEYSVHTTQAAALVIRPDREEPIVEPLAVDSDTIRTATLRLVDEMSPENINPVHPEWSSDFGFLEPLARALLDPVWPHLEGIDTICIVPQGHLFYLPFHALRLTSGKYVIEDRPLVYAPSAALMMYARLRRKASKPSRFVGFGTGKLDDPPARRQGFEDEALAISALPLWKEKEVLTAVAASGRAFLTRSAGADVVHCACHGHFDARDPFGSGLLLSDGKQLPILPVKGETVNAFVLSARDIAAVAIDADLVYLSACVSGRHDIRPGDEILGLVRALIRAGVASMIASLWPIAAWASTRQLMETFYTRWLVDGLPKARSMQAAQLETMKRHPHPYHWAPFSLFGDWR
jgi:CHAT domain-containing protein